MGIRGLILDLDNTLVQWGQPDPGEGLAGWVEGVRGAGLCACILSNNSPTRVSRFCQPLGLPGIPSATKPLGRAFRSAMTVLGTGPGETAVVGDQVFTDVMGGNRAGLYTILVDPMGEREFFGTRLVRRLEALWLGHLRRSGRLGPVA